MSWKNILKESKVGTKEEITVSAQHRANGKNVPVYIWQIGGKWYFDEKEPTNLPSQGTNYFTINPQ